MRRLIAASALLGAVACGPPPPMMGVYKYDPLTGGYYHTAKVRLHTEPPYTVALVDEDEEVGANSTLQLRSGEPHRVELRKAGYFGQVLHFSPNPEPPPEPKGDVSLADGQLGMKNRPAYRWFVVEVENLATGERRPIDGTDPHIALEPIPKIASAEAAPQVVAVMPTTARTELPPPVLDAVTDHLRVALAAQRIAVIDRGRLAEELARQVLDEKTNSYRACVDEACQVPLGRALAATHILRSSVTRLGDACALSAELIELKSEVTVAARYQDARCEGAALGQAADGLALGLLEGR
ncbi:MAG: hypothetical protein KC933_12940 [Myxococcales bacterium]|nr:hypothetical protein [Myxococcales bacterium]MCB9652270.1 hypothetical protein [Deltaproteobacteria bacterium]